jgi:hypothetical protein
MPGCRERSGGNDDPHLAGLLAATSALAFAQAAPAGAAESDDARLRKALTVEGILAHERAFQEIANRSGGIRAPAPRATTAP